MLVEDCLLGYDVYFWVSGLIDLRGVNCCEKNILSNNSFSGISKLKSSKACSARSHFVYQGDYKTSSSFSSFFTIRFLGKEMIVLVLRPLFFVLIVNVSNSLTSSFCSKFVPFQKLHEPSWIVSVVEFLINNWEGCASNVVGCVII